MKVEDCLIRESLQCLLGHPVRLRKLLRLVRQHDQVGPGVTQLRVLGHGPGEGGQRALLLPQPQVQVAQVEVAVRAVSPAS